MIKVTVGEQKTQSEKPFPKLMTLSDEKGTTIVFMLNKNGDGNGVHSNHQTWDFKGESFYKTGPWDIEDFTDYNEPITLQNA